MKKLNKKGYITIEVLIASIVAAVIAVFLIEITVKLVGRTDDAYVDTVLNTDKALIIKNIKENINKDIETYGSIIEMKCYETYCDIVFENSGIDPSKKRKILIKDKYIKYCDGQESENCNYEKKLKDSINSAKVSSNINGNVNSGNYINIEVGIENIFTDNNYNINIPIFNKGNTSYEIYKVIINKKLGINESKVLEQTIAENGSISNIVIEGNDEYNIFDNVTCTNSQKVTFSKKANNSIESVNMNLNNITNNTVCTASFINCSEKHTVEIFLGGNRINDSNNAVCNNKDYSLIFSNDEVAAPNAMRVECKSGDKKNENIAISRDGSNFKIIVENITVDTICNITY